METFGFILALACLAIGYVRQANKIDDLEADLIILKRAIIEERDTIDMVDDFDMEEAWWDEQPPGLWKEDPDAYQRWRDSLN